MTASGPDERQGATAAARLRVLVVCPTNRFISPIAAHLLRSTAARAGIDLDVGAAGTDADDGTPMHPFAAGWLESSLGLDVSGWRTTALTQRFINDADLVLCSDAATAATVISTSYPALRRCSRLLDWVRLVPYLDGLAAEPSEFRRLLPRHVAAARGRLQPPLHSLDMPDPVLRRANPGKPDVEIIVQACANALTPFRGARAGHVSS